MKPSKEKYYLEIAKQVAQRSTCKRRKFGSVIVKDDQIVATGYVGAPRKTKDCFKQGECLREKLNIPHGQHYELCRSVHSEMNAIINAARAGVSLLDGDIFIYGEDTATGQPIETYPCFICKKMIINAGLKRVVCYTPEGIKIYSVKDWVEEWQKKDMLEGKQYK